MYSGSISRVAWIEGHAAGSGGARAYADTHDVRRESGSISTVQLPASVFHRRLHRIPCDQTRNRNTCLRHLRPKRAKHTHSVTGAQGMVGHALTALSGTSSGPRTRTGVAADFLWRMTSPRNLAAADPRVIRLTKTFRVGVLESSKAVRWNQRLMTNLTV